MNQLFFYLIQVILASAIFHGYYYLFLRNNRFHKYNRFYLLIAVAFSILIPLIKLPVYLVDDPSSPSTMLQTLHVITTPPSNEVSPIILQDGTNPTLSFSISNILLVVYILMVLIILLRVLVSIVKIGSIIKKYEAEKIEKIKFINTNEPGTPFSFFRWLFWNSKIDLHSNKGKQIFRHEYYHIEQKHSCDTLFMEFISMIFWFNPVFHLVKREIKAIHEFLADEFATKEENRWQYAEFLLMQAFNTNNSLINPFFHNQIKRRIAMITKSSKPSFQYFRKIMVLPMAIVIFSLLAFSYKHHSNEKIVIPRANEPITVVIDAGHGGQDKGAINKSANYTEAQIALEISKTIQSLSSEYNVRVVMTREDEKLPGNASAINEGIRKRVEIVNNTKPDAFIAIHLGTTSALSQVSKSGFEVYVTNQRTNDADYNLANIVIGELKNIYQTKKEIHQRDDAGIYIIDKSNYPALLIECGFINNPADIKFISDGENQKRIARSILAGLVKFVNQTGSEKINANQLLDQIRSADSSKPRPLIVLDGVIKPDADLNSLIQPNEIESLTILKGETAIKKYGNKAKDGAIEINSKKGNNKITSSSQTVNEDYNKVFVKMDVVPSFPGGVEEWNRFLTKNLDPNVPEKKGIKQGGSYTVVV